MIVALPPEHLPAAARRAVVQSLLKTGLLEEVPADDDQPAWRTSDEGGLYRVSTAEQGQSGLGLEAQQASVRAFAEAQGWTVVGPRHS